MVKKKGRPKVKQVSKIKSYSVCVAPDDYKFFERKASQINLKFSDYAYLALKFFSLIAEEKRFGALKHFRLKSIKDIRKLIKESEEND